jgi:hypothetical protein
MTPPLPKSAIIIVALDARSHLQPAQGGDNALTTKGTHIPQSAEEILELTKKEPKEEPVVEQPSSTPVCEVEYSSPSFLPPQ